MKLTRLTYLAIFSVIIVVISVLYVKPWNTCIPDSCAFVNGLILGATASVFATLITNAVVEIAQRQALKKKYGRADGYYRGKEFEKYEEDEGEHKKGDFKWTLEKEFASEVHIEYKQDNILSITLKEKKGDHLTWTGYIVMELETYGSLVWEYINGLPSEQHRFGFKRFIISQRTDASYAYLIGEDGYGKEVLIESKKEDLTEAW